MIPEGTDSIGDGTAPGQKARRLPRLGDRSMPRTLRHPTASSPLPRLVPTLAVLLGLSLGDGPAVRAHEEEPVVDISRWFGPIDPRLDDAGEVIVFSYQGAVWRMPRGGGVMTRLTDGAGFDIA